MFDTYTTAEIRWDGGGGEGSYLTIIYQKENYKITINKI